MSKYAKSVVAALVAGLGALQTALVDNVVTNTEWITVAAATAAALGLVWGVQNKADSPAVGGDDSEVEV
jgi:hypothetical protein